MTIEEVLAIMDVSHGDMCGISPVWGFCLYRSEMQSTAVLKNATSTAECVCEHEVEMREEEKI